MKKFYIIFFISFIVLSVLLYISTWWFLAGITVIVLITVYQFYSERLKAFAGSVEEFELQVEELQKQLDHSLAKEERATHEVARIRQLQKELLVTLSHEIRTPMNAVLSMSLLLKDTALTTDQNEFVDTIKNSGEKLVASIDTILVNDVLEHSKLERRDKKTETEDFDLRNSIEEVVNMFVTTAGKKPIELLVDIDDAVPLQLSGDNRRLREILMNLIENAIKFTHQGQVLVSARSLNKESEEPVIRFEITDTGIGMTDEQMKQLFYSTPARGFDKNKKHNRGLIICNKYVKQMGGKIEVTSSPGSGTVFFVTIPFAHSRQTYLQTGGSASSANLEGKKILVVDDNPESRNIIIKQLRNWKMSATAVASATDAIDTVGKTKNFDLVLIDLAMPQMDGLQLARVLKKTYPHQQLVLLNSAWNDSYKHDRELFAGIFMKPLRHQVFRDNLVALFEHRSKDEEREQTLPGDRFATTYPLKILVAEDNSVNQKIAIKILGKLGYAVHIANNGKEAIEMLTKEHYDIILMDVQMPEMDGLSATRNIRAQMQTQPVIIALTANVLQGDHDACIQAGMNDYISKPILVDELTGKLKKWFSVINQSIS